MPNTARHNARKLPNTARHNARKLPYTARHNARKLSNTARHNARKLPNTARHNAKKLPNTARNNARKFTIGHMSPAKIQISLRIRAVLSDSPLGAFWTVKDAVFLHVDNEDSDQTARMRRLI